MSSVITDVWFRTRLSLDEIALKLHLTNIEVDCEDYWEWVIGTFSDTTLDITRTHTKPRTETDTRIFLDNNKEFSSELLEKLVTCVSGFVTGPIKCGRWVPQPGQEFERVAVREYAGTLR